MCMDAAHNYSIGVDGCLEKGKGIRETTLELAYSFIKTKKLYVMTCVIGFVKNCNDTC